MILTIVLVVLGLVLGYIVSDGYMPGFPMFIFAAGAALVGIFTSGIVSYHDHPEYHKDGRYELRQVSDATQREGSFFLGTGYQDEDAGYYFYRKTDTGSYYLEWVRRECAEVYEKKNITQPYVKQYTPDKDWIVDYGNMAGWCVAYDFYVPEGSITNDYVLNGPTQ